MADVTLDLPPTPALTLTRIEAQVYRAPLERPVRASFGAMRERPAVLVRVEDRDGAVGWGEIWCNFPSFGAEHRAYYVTGILAGLLIGRSWSSPLAAFVHLSVTSRVLALQTGEPGPIAQAIAGIDIALWDLAARRRGEPLFRLLGGLRATMPAYASGLGPDDPAGQAEQAMAKGHGAFKLKLGFGEARDQANLRSLRAAIGPDAPLAVDANQAFELTEAGAVGRDLEPFRPIWFEEPMPADTPIEAWRLLARACAVPLAGGENLRGDAAFDEAIDSGAFGVIQPDLAKWGGISAVLPLARRILRAGRRYCPHYLGGGIGLLASAHVLAAAGGDGMLEVDVNPNPLREGLAQPFPAIAGGMLTLSEAPGLGVAPDPALARYRVGP
jgi:D-galactarolactone cycloisomerase